MPSAFDAGSQLSLYAARADDGSIDVRAINKTGVGIDAELRLDGASGTYAVTADMSTASSLDATSMSYNGHDSPPVDLAQEMRATPVQSGSGPYDYSAEL